MSPPATGIGIPEWFWTKSGAPSSPVELSPQHHALPPDSIAQVWNPPAATVTNVDEFLTAVGATVCCPGIPSPSWPKVSSPQQYTPVAVTPHVCESPALIDVNLSPPMTSTGVEAVVKDPFPSCPEPFNPQQYASPEVAIAHVCELPALTALNETVQSTLTGPSPL